MIQEDATWPETANKYGGLNSVDYIKDGRPCAVSFKDVTDFNNLLKSALECCTEVRWKQSVQMFEIDILRWVSSLKKQLESGTYKTKGFRHFYIVERGKKRHIQSVHISERVVQKSLVNYVLKPVILPKLISANGASLKGKGTGYALKRLKQDLAYAYKKSGNDFYILTMDFHNYFNSIPHKAILDMVKPHIDDKCFELLSIFVNAFEGDYGLGLGSEISQILAIFYPNAIDHAMKEHYHIKGYGRYMDDIYMIHPDKEHLKECSKAVSDMAEKMGLCLNENKTVISKGRFTFLKKRILITDTGKIIMKPGRRNITKMRQKVKTIGKKIRAGETDPEVMEQLESAWNGYVKGLNAHNTDINMRKLIKEESHGICNTGTVSERD